jgi:hypothetical protein
VTADLQRQPGDGSGRLGWLLAGVLLAAAGCAQQKIDTAYGKRRGSEGGDSVNGTRVLAEMFESYGHSVVTRRYLSPKMSDYDVIVWFPDDFSPPTDEQLDFLEDWLYDAPNRTLVYVGRDYDAAGAYWDYVLPETPAEQVAEVLRRRAEARARYDQARTAMPAQEDCRWFRVRGAEPVRYVGRRDAGRTRLRGSWSRNTRLAPEQVDIRLQGRLLPLPEPSEGRYGGELRSRNLLAAGDDPLVWEITNSFWDGGRILTVVNGSFLVNFGLVEHEHRKLAGQLITSCGDSPQQVVFLESGAEGPPVFEQEPGEDYPTGFEAFVIWPIGAILMHFVVLGLVYLAARVPTFGRPAELPAPPLSDFGHHIEALGGLLERTQNSQYAQQRLEEYRNRVRHEASSGQATAGRQEGLSAGGP